MNQTVSNSSPPRFSFFSHLLLLAVLSITAMALIYFLTEAMVIRKLLTHLAMPVGFCWVGLLLLTYYLLVYRKSPAGWFCLMLTLVYTISSSSIVGGLLSRSLEYPYQNFSIENSEPFDVLVVLGGGTGFGYNRQPQLGYSGDRLMVALHMYQAGKAKKIVCTGSVIGSLAAEDVPTPGQASRTILNRAGVPAQDIELCEGRTTSEEMSNLKQRFGGKNLRIGIITSAWHLPRAMRLAAKNNLEANPVPADFASGHSPLTVLSFLPSSPSMASNARFFKEYLARLIGQ